MVKECIICGAMFDARNSAKTCSPECSKERHSKLTRERQQLPKYKEYARERRQRPEYKEWRNKYNQRPEVKERNRESVRRYRQQPEVKEHIREYNQRHDVRKRRRQQWRERSAADAALSISHVLAKLQDAEHASDNKGN
jgi:hypothetical protein